MAVDPLKIPEYADPGIQTLPVPSEYAPLESGVRVFYVSDLHLDLKMPFLKEMNDDEIREYLESVAQQLKDSYMKNVDPSYWRFPIL